ncbi:ATP-binding protein [Pseudomonas mendocina]|uniref:AAA family ATPase n=1 Tax=Ectopseudomonas mendocina TaxID=300 RepID=UPI0023D997FF|nr:ATP-binding protein [Pseudomonas mendocina]MDF2074111.1 ATP-binding protein [Pseudomonas mendocina]
MIYSFGASNLNSFKDGFQVSFELGSKVPKSVSRGKKLANVIGIKGANASGKTNILKALSLIAEVGTNSFSLKPDHRLGFSSYFDCSRNSKFYIDLEAGGIRYIYEITANEKNILRERIYKKISRKTLILERQDNKIITRSQDLSELDIIELRSNASVISTAFQYKFKTPPVDLLNIYKALSLVRGNVYSFGVNENPSFFKSENVSHLYFHNPEALDFAKSHIKKSDLGIVDVVVNERIDDDGSKRYFPLFLHSTDKSNHYLTIYEQSSGTVSLYKKLWVYWFVLKFGGTLVLDEFDANCHPMLLPSLISLFDDPEANPNDAQFIFTAQNSEILDTLGKYRTILVNKEQGESYCYRLDEIPGDLVRNDRPISPLYRDGKLGGIPKL